MTSYCRRPANFAAHERPTVGDTKFSFTDSNHMGWLKCDGSLLSKADYGLLFNIIGGTFGETATHFRLPDPLGRVLGVAGSGAGLTPRAKGDSVGEETHTLTINEMPAHKHGTVDVSGNTNGDGITSTNGSHAHSITDPGHSHTYVNNTNDQSTDNAFATETAADQADLNAVTGSSATNITINSNGAHTHTMGSTGGSNAHNNMQPTLFYGNMFIYCGKVNEGSFPYTTGTDLY